MSDPWSKLLDVDALADRQADMDFDIPLAEFPRVRSQLASAEGAVQGHVRFVREAGLPVAELELNTTTTLTCQRCIGPMSWPIASGARIALIARESDGDHVPEELEPLLAPGHRISLRDLVEEELMLSLPIVALHEREEDCALEASEAPTAPDDQPDVDENVQRPFERLNELLKRK